MSDDLERLASTAERCPLCKVGTINDGIPGGWCSKRYDSKRPCGFTIGDGESIKDALARTRKDKVSLMKATARMNAMKALDELTQWAGQQRGRSFFIRFHTCWAVTLISGGSGTSIEEKGVNLEDATRRAFDAFFKARKAKKDKLVQPFIFKVHGRPVAVGEHLVEAGNVTRVELVERRVVHTRRRENGEYWTATASWTPEQFSARDWKRVYVRPLKGKVRK